MKVSAPRHLLRNLFTVLALLPLLAVCAPPVQNGEDGNIRILLPGSVGARNAYTLDDTADFTYEMDFYGPDGETRHVKPPKGVSSVSLILTLGKWTVVAKAYDEELTPRILVGGGETSFTVTGRSQSVEILMDLTEDHQFWKEIDKQDFGEDAFEDDEIITRLIVSNNNDSGEGSWKAATDIIKDGGNDKNYVITLTADITISGSNTTSDRTFGTHTGIRVSLRGNKTITPQVKGALLLLGANQTLVLRETTLKGVADNNAYLVYITGNNSEFYMKSGEISDNTSTFSGGGVYVNNPGTFYMSGGKITNNKALSGGGVYVSTSGTFNMSGGVISGNEATSNGGGVSLSGSGSSLKKTGGIIYGSNESGEDENGKALKNFASGNGDAVHSSTTNRNDTAGESDNFDTSQGNSWAG
jgi:hypothetical protein